MIQNTSKNSPVIRTDTENIAAALTVGNLALMSCAGNGLVLISYFMSRKLRSQVGNCFTGNLALSGLMCAVYVQIPTVFSLANPKLYLKGNSCIFHSIVTWTILTSSNWTLAVISADRAIAINRPFQYPNWVTFSKARFIIAIIWISSLIISSSLINRKSVEFDGYELMCTAKWTKENAIETYFAAILCFWLPSTVLVVCNLSIIYAVRRLKSVVHTSPRTTDESTKFCVKDQTKTLRSLYLLVIVYLFCVSPYFLAKFSFVTNEKGLFPPSMILLAVILMFAASAANPFIYAILRKDHRESCLKCIRTICAKVESARLRIFGNIKE